MESTVAGETYADLRWKRSPAEAVRTHPLTVAETVADVLRRAAGPWVSGEGDSTGMSGTRGGKS